MVAERRSIALKSLSDESVERVVQCVDSSENEEMMTTKGHGWVHTRVSSGDGEGTRLPEVSG